MSVSVVICAYTMGRWDELQSAVESCFAQSHAPREVVIVVDYNNELLERARETFRDALVVANVSTKGLSGARNTGVAVSSSSIIAFLDDDAYADPRWLEELCAPMGDPNVVGAGGWILPHWPGEEPAWFPRTFLWVLGCSYDGLPADGAVIRNPIGANMALRRTVFESVGGFSTGIGRIGNNSLGCEETELSIRYSATHPDEHFVLVRTAVVHHRVPTERLTWQYFRRRCWAEGLSKAAVASMVGHDSGLAAERQHVIRAIPRELLSTFAGIVKRPTTSLAKAWLIGAGSIVTGAGLVRGHRALRKRPLDTDARDIERLANFIRDSDVVRAAAYSGTDAVGPLMGGPGGGGPANSGADATEPSPVALVQVDVDDAAHVALTSGGAAERFWVEVVKGGQVVGVVERRAESGELPMASLQELADEFATVQTSVTASVPDEQLPSVTVVIPTIYRRREDLAQTIDSLLAMDYPNFEVVIVDNRPGLSREPKIALPDDARVRVEWEPRPGISAARNRGIMASTGDVIAFTDDDVKVDQNWLRGLGGRFVLDPDVDAIGGMVRPSELATKPQLWFEEFFGGFTRSFEPEKWSLEIVGDSDPLFPYSPGKFAAGCNMGFRRRVFDRFGGFNQRLGTGTPAKGGEDLAMFIAVVLGGGTVAYEPSALVRHSHRRTEDEFMTQVFGYGAGLTAMYTALVFSDPHQLVEIGNRLAYGVRQLMRPAPSLSTKDASSYPRNTRSRQLLGMAYGPLAYVRSVVKSRFDA